MSLFCNVTFLPRTFAVMGLGPHGFNELYIDIAYLLDRHTYALKHYLSH